MSTRTVAVFPVLSALAKAYKVGKALTPWQAVNKEQERYLSRANGWEEQLRLFSDDELKTIASFKAEEINQWLKDSGYDITLKQFPGPDDFGTASIMTVLVKWITPGEETELLVGGKAYESAKLEEDIIFTRVKGYEHVIAHIPCENGDAVHMTVADRDDLEGLDLLDKVISLSDGERDFEYRGVVFPMIDHDAEVDISFFEEMYFKGRRLSGGIDRCKVAEAKQQTKFKMNHLGAKAESAAAMAMQFECCMVRSPKPNLEITAPPYVWMTRPGMDTPYFASYIDKQDWKNPGNMD